MTTQEILAIIKPIRERLFLRNKSRKPIENRSPSAIVIEGKPTNEDGGPGSGNHGHAGVPGKRGGSAPSVGEVKSGKLGTFRPRSSGAREIDTADAFKEAQTKKNSLSEHMDATGKLSAERQAVHDEIIRKFFDSKKAADGKPTLVMSGGGPASGKTFVRTEAESHFGPDSTVTIDPDSFKAMLPGYEEMALKTDKAAGFYHEESSALAKRAYQYAADNGVNVVYDGTGDGSVKSVLSKLKVAQDAGYEVNASYVTVDTEEALKRNYARYESQKAAYDSGKSTVPPRLPHPDLVAKTHMKVSDISIQVANKFDHFELYDNNVAMGEKARLIATCVKGGEITAVPGCEDKLQKYLDKGMSGAKVVDGKVKF